MKKIILFVAFFSSVLVFGNNAPEWGKTGHRATAEIASSYLTKKAKKAVANLLDGDGMALIATFGDDIKSDHAYDKYSVWHYTDIPSGKTYKEFKDQVGHDIIYALKKCEAGLKDPATPRDKKQFYLKMLIHLMGDLHQPLHVGHPEDKGGNDIIVTWFGQPSNLHRVWDSDMINSFLMSYTELAANQKKLTPQQIKAIQKGGFLDWLKDSRKITEKIYNDARGNGHLSYDYMYKWMPVVRTQLQKGGIRLAKVLNEIYG